MRRVPQGMIVRYGYVSFGRLDFEQHGGLYLPAVQEKVNQIVNMGNGDQPMEAPFGYWREDGTFAVQDGRHRVIGSVIAGFGTQLVRWLDRFNPEQDRPPVSRPELVPADARADAA